MKNLDKMSIRDVGIEIVNNHDLKIEIAMNMMRYGGGFVQALGNCILKADRSNLSKLCETFFDYILNYEPSRWKGKNENS